MKSKKLGILVILLIGIALFFLTSTSQKTIADEISFITNVQNYANGEVTWKTNDLPQTPLFLITFGTIQKYLNLSLFSLRLSNLFLLLILLSILLYNSESQKDFLKLFVVLAIVPYFLFLGTVFYTDMLFMLLLLLGFVFYDQMRFRTSTIFFALAISTRQFGVIFPLALAIINLRDQDKRKWIYPALSCLALVFWFLMFDGSLTPQSTLSSSAIGINFFSGLIFLATFGAFYKISEMIMFPEKRSFIQHMKRWALWGISGMIILLFLLAYNIPQNMLLLNPHHWFSFFYHSDFAIIAIALLGALPLAFFKDKFEIALIISSFFMFCFLNVFFDKYVVPYAVILGYQLIKQKIYK